MAPVVPYQSATAWKACLFTLDVIGILGTFLRLWLRYKKSKLWWDDAAVLFPTAAMVAAMVYYEHGMWIFETPNFLEPTLHNHWKGAFLLLSVVWWSRIVLAIGLVRIFPSWSRSRHVAVGLAACFGAIWLFLIIYYPASCHGTAGWTKVNWFQCPILSITPSGFATILGPTLSLILNYIGDSLLVICPLYMLWGLKLPTSERRLILVLFSSSLATFIVVIAMTVVFNTPFEYTESRAILCGALTHLECTIGLLVCNIVPVAGFFYRVYRSTKGGRTLVYLSGSGTKKAGVGGSTSLHNPTTITKSITVEVDNGTDKHHIPLTQYGGRGVDSDSFNDQKGGVVETKAFDRAD